MQVPSEKWSLTQLSKFVSQTSKKWAIDGWALGRALNIVKAKLPHGDWRGWCAKNCADLSKDTILRLRTLADKYRDPECLSGKRLMQCYLEAGILRPQTRETVKTPDKGKEVPATVAKGITRPSKDVVADLRQLAGLIVKTLSTAKKKDVDLASVYPVLADLRQAIDHILPKPTRRKAAA